MKRIKKPFIAAVAALVLTGCGNTNTENTNTELKHNHTFDSTWNYDEENHWHAANCGHSEEKSNLEKHVDSDSNGVCDVCEYVFSKDTSKDLNYIGRKQIRESMDFSTKLVENGAVLLKNNNNCLPLNSQERKITLFGRGCKNLVTNGGGETAAPNSNSVVSLDRAFEENGFEINRAVWDSYDRISGSSMFNPSTKIESASKICNGGALRNDILASCDEFNDAAIVTISRICSENTDAQQGSLSLNDDEKTVLKAINDSGKFTKIIVLINTAAAMSMDWADNPEYGIDAILYIGLPGYYGANAIPGLIAGEKKDINGNIIKVNPSGSLTNSFATSAESSPAYQNFGDQNVAVYKEGVYVGYKYYETRYEDCVLGNGDATSSAGIYFSQNNSWNYADEMGYPFGFGLSYTTFEQKILETNYDDKNDEYNFLIEVKNTGNLKGKTSVQLYAHEPYTEFDKTNGLGKSAIQLVGYDKVEVESGKTVETTITVPRYLLATYDNVVNKTYILEGGDYYFSVGNGAHDALNNIISVQHPGLSLVDHLGITYVANANAVKKITISEDVTKYKKNANNVEITNQFDDADYNTLADKNSKDSITYLDRQDWQNTWPTKTTTSPATANDLDMSSKYKTEINYSDDEIVEYGVPNFITFDDMINVPLKGTIQKGKFAGQDGEKIWDDFIEQLSLDDLITSIGSSNGLSAIKSIRKPGTIFSNGYECILGRNIYGNNNWSVNYTSASITAGTFDNYLQNQLGDMLGLDAELSGNDLFVGPNGNINRTPFSGMAAYFTGEDSILAYYTVSNSSQGAKKHNAVMRINSCALNNQEKGRQRLQTYCNEQAIREIYLKPFEGAITKGGCMCVTTSYNRIGATYAACHQTLINEIFRKEWNYKGMVCCDPLTGSNTDPYSNGPAMLQNGTDCFLLDPNRGGQIKSYIVSTNNTTLIKCLQRANKNIFYTLLSARVSNNNRNNHLSEEAKKFEDSIFTNDVKQNVANASYDFLPEDLIIKEEESYSFDDQRLLEITNYDSRDNATLVYEYEGTYCEGYQGDFTEYVGNIYLWDDGIFTGTLNSTKVKGYWYNSSLDKGKDANGNDIKDCLVLDGGSPDTYMQAELIGGYVDSILKIKIDLGWGIRTMVLRGNYYYPNVCIKMVSNIDKTTYKVGEYFSLDDFDVVAVNSNLKYMSIFQNSNVVIYLGEGNVVDGKIAKSGGFDINVTYGDFTTTLHINTI